VNLSESHTFHKREEPNDNNCTKIATDKTNIEETSKHTAEMEGAGSNSGEMWGLAQDQRGGPQAVIQRAKESAEQ
jgi:hypothetical protein